MSTITAILEADPDGTLHLPLPVELRQGKVAVVATLEAADEGDSSKLAVSPAKLNRRRAAFAELRMLGGGRQRHTRPRCLAAASARGSVFAWA